MSILVLLKPCLAGEGALDLALSQKSCGRPGRCQTWGCSRPGPCPGPRPGPHPGPHPGSRDLIVPNLSLYHLIFQRPLHFWPPIFIQARIPLAVPCVPQKIGLMFHPCSGLSGLYSHLSFLNSCFFFLFWLNVYSFLLLQIIDLCSGFLPFTVGSLYIFLYFTLHSLHFSFWEQTQ